MELEIKTINVFGKRIQIQTHGCVKSAEKVGDNIVNLVDTYQSGRVETAQVDTVRLFNKQPHEFVREFNMQCQLSLGMEKLDTKQFQLTAHQKLESDALDVNLGRASDMSSNKHLFRCVDLMAVDANLSEQTKIVMFLEYGKLVIEEYEKQKQQIKK